MGFLVSAFVAVWLLVTGYVLFLSLRQRQLNREIETLNELLEEREARSSGK